MKEYLKLFWSFFKIGLFTFGGGYAMIPMFEKELIEKRGWITEDELLDYYSISQCTPGVLAVNVSTFVGAKIKGALGAAVTILGVLTPSIIIITLIAMLLSNYSDMPYVQHALAGIRAAVCALIFSSVIKLIKSGIKSPVHIVIAVISFAAVGIFGASPIIIVVFSAIFGFFFYKGYKKDGGKAS